MSYVHASFMPRLDYPFKPATRVVETNVGGSSSVPPRPTCRQSFLHPFKTPTPVATPLNPSLSGNPPSSLNTSSPTSTIPIQQLDSQQRILVSSSRTIKARKAQSGRQITHNALRPHVPAADRLFVWDTPHAARHRQHLIASLPPQLVESAMMSIRGAYAPNTKSTYAAGTLRFTQFCDAWGIDEEARMPASYPLLCAFIGEHKGKQSGNTIRSWLSGIRAWHTVNHAPWFGDDDWVQLARISANKEGSKHKRPLRAPVSIEHLLTLRRSLTLSTPLHAAVWALALCAFFGCRRLGELTVTTAAAFDETYNVLRSVIITFRKLRDGSSSASFHIPWTKTTKELGASVILTARNDILCPVAALKNHLNVNSSSDQSTPLFAYKTASSQSKMLLKHEFLNFCNHIWSSAMLAHILGHSFRIGGAVELLLAGVPPEIVAATGGWTSLAFLLYWRRMEEILPMSTSKAYNKSHIDSLAAIFELFRIKNKIPSALIVASDGNLSL